MDFDTLIKDVCNYSTNYICNEYNDGEISNFELLYKFKVDFEKELYIFNSKSIKMYGTICCILLELEDLGVLQETLETARRELTNIIKKYDSEFKARGH